jgi:hypothetical protein
MDNSNEKPEDNLRVHDIPNKIQLDAILEKIVYDNTITVKRTTDFNQDVVSCCQFVHFGCRWVGIYVVI